MKGIYIMEFEISFVNQPNIVFSVSINQEAVNNVSACLIDDIAAIVAFNE